MSLDISKVTKTAALGWLFVLTITAGTFAQAKRPIRPKPTAKAPATRPAAGKAAATMPASYPGVSVNRVDDVGFRKLLVPNGKPLMINFWATWCGPCREEFPDLVKLDAEYKDKIDFITVSLDEEEEINTGVPKFLAGMNAKMPTFVLITPDEEAAIAAVTKDWAGALPFTVIYDPKGAISYIRQGAIKPDTVRAEINKLLPPVESAKSAP